MRKIRFRERDKDLRDNWEFKAPEPAFEVYADPEMPYKTASLYDRMAALANLYTPPKPYTYE